MADSSEIILSAYLILEIFDLFGIKFDYFIADLTDHMVVMSMAVSMFVHIALFRSRDFFDKAALDQEVQCPVNRGPGGPGP